MGTREIAIRPWSEDVEDDSRSSASDDSLVVTGSHNHRVS